MSNSTKSYLKVNMSQPPDWGLTDGGGCDPERKGRFSGSRPTFLGSQRTSSGRPRRTPARDIACV
jgi:hypothetical protein